MKNKENFKKMNWAFFIILVLIGIITAVITLYDLSNPTRSFDEGQSRAEFRWGSMHTMYIGVLLILSIPLALGWKRLFPFNVPLVIILAGFCYELFFLTFTVGWVGIQGMIGLFFAFLAGGGLIISHSISIYNGRQRTFKK